ncbi:hypothetical protein [Staphylococcus pettenkoferi]|uniref:hypothetical protein n=1 Tax=Staphylococcus pettenkoferi TaxID=170573 RepID=UPI00024329B4|nr:hypothetical protein [Staphylococcus pettenkoferi]ASE37826.1 hypothetical protein CEP67_11250 [Staphylococcus pettenkoferi]EHM66401.1 hypothetical protein SEVCU012_0068 [Staphylococcus pettenkoferi VCU012]MCY1580474.1 hypothetical protein [Staphylococcus pettenkoferi]MCY1619654.1 hypothetical protein [Staphylococcus pettenkoferi]
MVSEEEFRLLKQSVTELAAKMGNNQLETYSVSLLFLEMDYGMESFNKIFTAFLRYTSERHSDDMNADDLKVLIDKYNKSEHEISDFMKNKIIIGFATNYIPNLGDLANELQTDMIRNGIKVED